MRRRPHGFAPAVVTHLTLYERLDARQRLAFYPCMAHFILSFGDLNKYLLRVEPTADAHQQAVNQHSYEGPGSEWMRFLWSEETHFNRVLTYRLAALVEQCSALERLVLIESIEETGNVLFQRWTEELLAYARAHPLAPLAPLEPQGGSPRCAIC